MKHLRTVVLSLFTLFVVLTLRAGAQGYMLNEQHPLRYTGRATASAAEFSFQVFPSNATRVPVVHVQVPVDTIGVWGTDSLVVSFNGDTLASHTIVLHANIVAGQPFEYLSQAYSNVRSLEFKSNVALKFRAIID